MKVEHNNPVAAEKKGKEIIHIHTNTTYSQQERDLRLYTPYKEENNSTLRNTMKLKDSKSIGIGEMIRTHILYAN